MVKITGFCIENDEFCGQNDGCCIQNDGLFVSLGWQPEQGPQPEPADGWGETRAVDSNPNKWKPNETGRNTWASEVRKNDDFCSKTEECGIKNVESCIENDDFCRMWRPSLRWVATRGTSMRR